MAKQPTSDDVTAASRQAMDEGAKIADRAKSNVQSAARAGLRTASEAADRAAGQAKEGVDELSEQGRAAVRRSQQSMTAAAGAGGAVMQGVQEITQAWMGLAQDRMQRMADGMRALAACRTPADLIKAQTDLMQGAMEQMVDTNRRVAEVSMRVMQEVTGQVAAPSNRDPA